jgi:hypothetical protein
MRRICVLIGSFLRAVAPASRADRRRATVLSVPQVCLTGSGSQERAHPGDQIKGPEGAKRLIQAELLVD